jgi:hypothetical protein
MADESENTGAAARPAASQAGANLPLIITLVALLLFFSFQTLSLLSERSSLGVVKSNQEGALQEAQKVQAQFKLLVTKTGELADQGHAGAKMIMEGLQRQGVGFAPESSAPPKPAAKAAK